MTRLSFISAVFFAAVAASSMPAQAEDLPSWFVSQDTCTSKPCTCDDIPMMEAFLANQKNGGAAWSTVKSSILTPTGPASVPDAIALFNSTFSGDPSIVTHFKSCPGYDPAKNNPNKVAGVSTFGSAALDPCFCSAFCSDIVNSTVAHEKMHVPTIIAGVVSKGDILIGCKLGVLKGRLCDVVAPLALADSEILSYDAGVKSLQAALDNLKAHDPANPNIECTWNPVTPPPQQASVPVPSGFFARLKMIVHRIIHGATSSVAALDAAKR